MRSSLQAQRARIRPDQPVRDVHERSLTGPVLPQQRVDLAGAKRKIGPAQCLHGAESLLDAGKLENRGHQGQRPVGWS